jgi:nucleoside-diphosphate-sugar epimerase|tara:strand:+ start:4314 stop:5087 length:774 start_codon:yes stop_codon:yes gene_type:complete
MKILITGKNGYIAKSLMKALSPNYNITSIGREDFELLDINAVEEWFNGKYFDLVIHTAVVGGNRLIPENVDMFSKNIMMYDNLMKCRDKFDRFIHFGSGAEVKHNTPYGFSKRIINKMMKSDPGSINIRIYSVFDENELDQRFIKSSIQKYINREDIIIHQDKKMDLFYMKDLISLVEWHIGKGDKSYVYDSITCNYLEKNTLFQVANMINNLDEHKVNIKIENDGVGDDYCEPYSVLPFKLIGLEEGIKETYNKLK